ncbi:MAG: DUF1232 domain-containing protein [Bacteroidales bacterium]|nr:DUF1232 domain-containing protein [Bacteroidales bacterium]
MDNFKDIAGNAEKLLDGIKRYAVKGGKETTKIMLELYYVMVAKETPSLDKILIGAALAYQTVPTDLLPRSKFGLLGFFDNAAALMFAYKKVKKAVTPEISQKVDETLEKWFGGRKDTEDTGM